MGFGTKATRAPVSSTMYEFAHSPSPEPLRLCRTGPSLPSLIHTTILAVSRHTSSLHCINGYADEEAAIRAGTPRSNGSPSPGILKEDEPELLDINTSSPSVPKSNSTEIQRSTPDSPASTVATARSAARDSGISGGQKRTGPDNSSTTRLNDTANDNYNNTTTTNSFLNPQDLLPSASADRWRSLNAKPTLAGPNYMSTTPTTTPTMAITTTMRSMSNSPEAIEPDLNVGLFLAVIADDMSALAFALDSAGRDVEQGDDDGWRDGPLLESDWETVWDKMGRVVGGGGDW